MKLKYESLFNYYNTLVPSKSMVPQWYKDISRWIGTKPTIYPNRNHTVKHCMPFLDALTSGYQVLLPFDVMVEQRGGKPFVTWLGQGDLIVKRNEKSFGSMPLPIGFHDEMYAIRVPLSFRLPKGYSMLYTQPFNRYDLVTMTMTAVIDSDVDVYSGDAPFFIKQGFEGIIEQGTPIAQILPFKREDWQSEVTEGLTQKAEISRLKSISVLSGWYKNNVWKKKSYE